MTFFKKDIVNLLEKSPIYLYIFLTGVLLFSIFIYYAEDLPIVIHWKEKIQEKIDEYRKRAIVYLSLIHISEPTRPY